MLKRFFRCFCQLIILPITIICVCLAIAGVFIDVFIMPFEYIITGKAFFDYWPSERPLSKPFVWVIETTDNASYYLYCKVIGEKYKDNYWLLE